MSNVKETGPSLADKVKVNTLFAVLATHRVVTTYRDILNGLLAKVPYLPLSDGEVNRAKQRQCTPLPKVLFPGHP